MSIRCAIYTRKSTEEGLEQDFNSLDAQRDACEAYIKSQRSLGWRAVAKHYDDGGISGGTLERPALKRLLADIEQGRVDLVVVYKVDRLTRSLTDFSKIIETFDAKEISFVSVTQQFNTANSMGRLTLNMLLSFAQFEREVTAERIRDKFAASKRKGIWMGGMVPLGYDVVDRKLIINEAEAKIVRNLFDLYLQLGSVSALKHEATRRGYVTKRRQTGKFQGGRPFSRGHLCNLLRSPLYAGNISHYGEVFEGQHEAIISSETWNAVQQALDGKAPDRQFATNRKHGLLLTGLVFDETGDRLSPVYTKKRGRKYIYYVSKRLTEKGQKLSDGWRLPSHALESVLLRALKSLLADENSWLKLVDTKNLSVSDYEDLRCRVVALYSELERNEPTGNKTVVGTLVSRVVIKQGALSIAYIKGALTDNDHSSKCQTGFEQNVPFQLRRRGVENKIIIGGKVKSPPSFDQNLIAAISRSFRWWSLMTKEANWSIQRLAEDDGMDASDVTRLLPLVFLAPDIIEAIIEGRQSVDLNLEKIKKSGPIPMAWEEQRARYGFPSSASQA